MSAISTIKALLRSGDAPKPPKSLPEQAYFNELTNWLSNAMREVQNYTYRAAQPISVGWTTTGTFAANQRGPIGNATITSASNFAAGSRTIVVSAASGTANGVPWIIAVNSVLNIEPGSAKQEYVLVTAASGTSITATFANAHDGSSTPYAIQVFAAGPQLIDFILTLVADMKSAGSLGS